MADLEAVLADVSYLMAMEKSKSTPAASASKKIVLPDRTYVSNLFLLNIIFSHFLSLIQSTKCYTQTFTKNVRKYIRQDFQSTSRYVECHLLRGPPVVFALRWLRFVVENDFFLSKCMHINVPKGNHFGKSSKWLTCERLRKRNTTRLR